MFRERVGRCTNNKYALALAGGMSFMLRCSTITTLSFLLTILSWQPGCVTTPGARSSIWPTRSVGDPTAIGTSTNLSGSQSSIGAKLGSTARGVKGQFSTMGTPYRRPMEKPRPPSRRLLSRILRLLQANQRMAFRSPIRSLAWERWALRSMSPMVRPTRRAASTPKPWITIAKPSKLNRITLRPFRAWLDCTIAKTIPRRRSNFTSELSSCTESSGLVR